MKRFYAVGLVALLVLAFSASSFAASGLSLETHMKFSPRDGEKTFMTTFTGWADDSTGGWFFFIDLNSAPDYRMGYGSEYLEINRDFSFGKIFGSDGLNELSLHLEYNGSVQGPICYFLTGLKYELNGYPYILTLSASAKLGKSNNMAFDAPDPTWQVTLAWNLMFADELVNFNGFVDFWNNTEFADSKIAFLAQPQLLVNLGKLGLGEVMDSFWIGTEVEIRLNAFTWDSDDLLATPSVFIRYDF